MRNSLWLVIWVFLIVSCTQQPGATTPISSLSLRPYETAASDTTPTQPEEPTSPAITPLASPTPFNYSIRAGDTLGAIAEKFNVDLDALLAINPDINPNGMTVGDTLKIPSEQKITTAESTPTPAGFALQPPACYATADRGLWCFALAHNDSQERIENVTAQMLLLDGNGQQIRREIGLLPLDILPPGESLPISVFFAPEVPPDVHAQVQVITAIRLPVEDLRYLQAAIQNTQVEVDQSGYSAQVSGHVALPAGSKAATHVWVAAVAYDATGRVTGVRRWESSGDLAFSFLVSSIGGRIDRVEFSVEARP